MALSPRNPRLNLTVPVELPKQPDGEAELEQLDVPSASVLDEYIERGEEFQAGRSFKELLDTGNKGAILEYFVSDIAI